MSSTGTALIATAALSREELERQFCERLSDDCLRIAIGSRFDARFLWAQRDEAFSLLAANGLHVPMVNWDTFETLQ